MVACRTLIAHKGAYHDPAEAAPGCRRGGLWDELAEYDAERYG